MESSATGKCIPHKSRKRVFPESSSGTESKGEPSSAPGNRTLKGKNKMRKQNEDNKGIIISPTSQSHTGMESSNPWFLDSVNTQSTRPDHAMPSSPSMVSLHTWLDSTNHKHKGVKTSFNPAKGTKRTAGSRSSTYPSLRLQKSAMKVKSVKKLVKTRSNKMSSSSKQITPMEDSRKIHKSSNVAGSSSNIKQHENNEILRKYPNFKKFDIVKDHSDHHYQGANSEMMQKNWAKKIQREWKILEKNLPDTIFVRVYESRMDLLRAVIIGAEGTPYHDGLFFFDVCFPYNYPAVPPKVYYHSGGLRINPNLYEDGKVCLSLLNTWIGETNENWTPGVSTMLQVLVSIQGLILNAKPYFNEPGFADSIGSNFGENQSILYNERTLIYSLKTMVYTVKNPPKHFRDLVIRHFCDRAVTILTTCRGYINGVGVGCCEKGSRGFGKNVGEYMGTLVGAFKEIGVENVDEFVPKTRNLAQKIRDFFGI
ncbi:hypothetical protein L2E82_37570 [Cichorium intybus]|uniref:Uncharacterized protein n=1 Tax=Cichorium intybus TaxID=13427 RepID=A0ACB9AFW4_CICIN|nr:hypothetical protein L2E82_37570 [Cichorium intybus]